MVCVRSLMIGFDKSVTSMQELADWNMQYRQKFGFVFLICASGRTSSEILIELKVNLSFQLVVT